MKQNEEKNEVNIIEEKPEQNAATDEDKKTDIIEDNNVVSDANSNDNVETETKKSLSKKAKVTIISIVAVITVVILAFLGWYLYQEKTNIWDVKQAEITVEYGKRINLGLSDLVDTGTYTKVTSDNTTITDNFEYVNVESEAEDNEETDTTESYLEIGEYEIDVSHTIEYRLFSWVVYSYEDTKQVSIIVQDTVAPVLSEDNPTEIEVIKDCELENVSEKFKATDLSEIEFSIDEENVDLTTVGEYTTYIYATDTSGNVSSAEITVKVKEPTIKLDTESVDLKVGETTTVKATVKGKDETVEWTSSDDSIATVENGTITAVKAGTATITAKANDVEETVNVTVTKVTTSTASSGSSSSSSSSNSGSSSKSSNSSSSSSGSSSSNSSSSSSNSSSSSSSSTTKKSETTTETTTSESTTEAYWCTEGGTHHVFSVGVVGWYSTFTEAENAAKAYITANSDGRSGGYEVFSCLCGLYSATVHFNE